MRTNHSRLRPRGLEFWNTVSYTAAHVSYGLATERAKAERVKGSCTTAASFQSKHHETKLCSPGNRLGPAVGVELGQNGGDVKLRGVEGYLQPTRDRFVGGAVRHGGKHFKFARRQPCAGCVVAVGQFIGQRASIEQGRNELAWQDGKAAGDGLDRGDDFVGR